MANKPCVVVPNHMLEQFTREWMQLYPQARVLATSIDDLAMHKRRRLVARIATGDWDAIIVSRSAFERTPSPFPPPHKTRTSTRSWTTCASNSRPASAAAG